MTTTAQAIFCCSSATPLACNSTSRLHNDPNREVHDAILYSFLAFAVRRQRSATLMALVLSHVPEDPESPRSEPALPCRPSRPEPVLTPEALKNNPLTTETPYVIHLTSRHDFGPVYSHRYFICPQSLQHDWIEISLEQWFAAYEQTPKPYPRIFPSSFRSHLVHFLALM